MRALVTGGAGFVGSALVDRLLAEGHAVDVVDDLSSGSLANLADARADRAAALTIHHLDVRAAELRSLLARRRPEVVFHLAGGDVHRAEVDPVAHASVEVLGTLNVLEAARQAEVGKVCFASSSAIYGRVPAGKLPVREGQAHAPLVPSAVAKDVVGAYLAVYRDLHQLEHTVLALADVYGPRDRRGPVGTLVAQVLAGEPCTAVGGPERSRDLVHVDDAVDAFVRAATRGGGLVVHVGTGIETSTAELAATVADEAGLPRPALVAQPAGPGDVARMALHPGRAAIQLGWKPWTDLATGVRSTLDWARSPR